MTVKEFNNVITWYITQDDINTAIKTISLITKLKKPMLNRIVRFCIEQKSEYASNFRRDIGYYIYEAIKRIRIDDTTVKRKIENFNLNNRFEEL